MSNLLKLLQSLLCRTESRHDLDEAYLADAVDISDLERRMRTIDERGSNPFGGIGIGLSR